jgi:SM-20-related protein
MNVLTFQKRQLDERPLILIDGLFQEDFINLFDRFLQALPCYLSDYDGTDTRHVLHWKHEFTLEYISTNPFLKHIYSRIRSATEKACPEPQIQLKRVHCNISLYGDMQLPHRDITPGMTGMTWLYYSNAVWETKWMGETIFYDSNEEPVYAVFPKPGRVVVFAADILHRGGVPSRECVAARRSLVFKFIVKADTTGR